jgi:hypothetical protein
VVVHKMAVSFGGWPYSGTAPCSCRFAAASRWAAVGHLITAYNSSRDCPALNFATSDADERRRHKAHQRHSLSGPASSSRHRLHQVAPSSTSGKVEQMAFRSRHENGRSVTSCRRP